MNGGIPAAQACGWPERRQGGQLARLPLLPADPSLCRLLPAPAVASPQPQSPPLGTYQCHAVQICELDIVCSVTNHFYRRCRDGPKMPVKKTCSRCMSIQLHRFFYHAHKRCVLSGNVSAGRVHNWCKMAPALQVHTYRARRAAAWQPAPPAPPPDPRSPEQERKFVRDHCRACRSEGRLSLTAAARRPAQL